MANNGPVLTAPLAVVTVNGEYVGKMRGVQYSENTPRQPIKGIGTIIASEMPVLDFSGSLTCDEFMVQFSAPALPGAENRNVQNTGEWENDTLLKDQAVQVDLLRKVNSGVTTPSGTIVPGFEIFATIKAAYKTSDSFNINEGQVSGRNAQFNVTEPVIYPQ